MFRVWAWGAGQAPDEVTWVIKAPSPLVGEGHGVRAGEGRWRNTRTDTPGRLLPPNSEHLPGKGAFQMGGEL